MTNTPKVIMTPDKLKELKELAEKDGWYAHRSVVLELIAEIEELKEVARYNAGTLASTIASVGMECIPNDIMKSNLIALDMAGFTGDGVDGFSNGGILCP